MYSVYYYTEDHSTTVHSIFSQTCETCTAGGYCFGEGVITPDDCEEGWVSLFLRHFKAYTLSAAYFCFSHTLSSSFPLFYFFSVSLSSFSPQFLSIF